MGKVLEGKVAVITGSGRGIGREMALLMASEGAKVVVNDLGGATDGSGASAMVADQVVAEIKANGGQAVANFGSVADLDGAEGIIQTAIDNFGKIDILVNNAGILRDRMIWNMTDKEFDDVIKVHVWGHFYCTRAALRRMRESISVGQQTGGRIINFASDSGIRGNAGQPNYCFAKMGVVGFTYSTAIATERFGVTCNAISPRASTRLTDTMSETRLRQLAKERGYLAVDETSFEDLKIKYLGGSPAGIAPFATWLASDASQHVTGQVFSVQGNRIALFSKMEHLRAAYSDGPFDVESLSRVMEDLLPKAD
ncbi:MAG: SDR family NAD(P)-dependent oxidoreductase [Dehalococcoidia bacterium]|nr:SDR family NAD(P)-dependent oxidoreductase [Dehalococcoidia bacterium]